jgi:hypothetical protein
MSIAISYRANGNIPEEVASQASISVNAIIQFPESKFNFFE